MFEDIFYLQTIDSHMQMIFMAARDLSTNQNTGVNWLSWQQGQNRGLEQKLAQEQLIS